MKTISTNKLIILMIILMTNSIVFSATLRAVSNASWFVASTWDLNRLPTCGDNVIIPNGRTVTLTQDLNFSACSTTTIFVDGILAFSNGSKIRMALGGCIRVSSTGQIRPSASGTGSSESITIASQIWWKTSDGTLFGSPSGVNLGCGVMLPIELLNFSLENKDQKILINWATASERDNDYFKIECSQDSYTWEKIAIIKGAGNSVEEINYQLTDENPFVGISYYRLTQYDYNGKATVLEVKSVEVLSTEYVIYPIPVNQSMYLKGKDIANTKVSIFNSVGEKIQVEQSFIGNEIHFDFNHVKNGTYFVSTENDNMTKTQKINVMH